MRILPNDKYIILEGYRGSVSHGVYVKDYIDDKDIFGIFIPPKKYIIGLGKWEMYEKKEDDLDILYYSIRKFFHLALRGNPNVLSLLWLRPEYYIKITEWGRLLIENRNIFVGKHCYHSFIGYAYGQLRRMGHFSFEGYMGERRKELVRRFGYDVKNASHCIRILKMGIEFLIEGKLNVFRSDRQQLLSIKMGEWSLEQVRKEAEKLFDLAKESYVKSNLPIEPDYEAANDLLINIIENYWGKDEKEKA